MNPCMQNGFDNFTIRCTLQLVENVQEMDCERFVYWAAISLLGAKKMNAASDCDSVATFHLTHFQ